MKTTLRKRIGAMALCIAMVLSMSAGFSTALAADVPGAGGGAANSKPKLFIDFLGDNAGNGTLPAPKDATPADTDWKYTTTNGTPDKTIFWVGVGIDNIDEFVLANKDGNKGLSSLELGFYYNAAYVRPYTGTTPGDDTAYLAALNSNNIGTGKNQWSSDYEVAAAVSTADPLAGSKTDMTVNDPATQEYTPPAGWKMTYMSIHKRDSATGANRFADAATGADKYKDTQYVAMIPFVLTGIDTDTTPALCFRLAMNAFVFSAGSGGEGHSAYGAWEKNTGNDPDHNLKLMLDFTGDLNIFTGGKESTSYTASLVLSNGGREDNTAELGIWKDPAPKPVTIKKNGEVLSGLLSGTRMELKLACVKGFSVKVKVTAQEKVIYEGSHPAAASVTAYTEYFTMPDNPDENVTVTVTYEGSGQGDAEYVATLDIDHSGPDTDPAKNTVTMSYTDNGTTHKVDKDNDTLNLPSGTVVNLTVATNSEYDVEIKITSISTSGGDPSVVPHQTITDQKSYTFTMPSANTTAKVTFTKATHHEAKLVVKNGSTSIEANKAKLSYTIPGDTPADDKMSETELVHEGYAGGKDTVKLRNGRTVVVTIPNTYDKAYAVKSVVISPKTPGTFEAFDATTVIANATYAFTMPKAAAEVTVTFAEVDDYQVKLVIVGAPGGGTATLSGEDARGPKTTSADGGIIAVFMGTTVNITTVVPTNYSATVTIKRPNNDTILPDGVDGAWYFELNGAYPDDQFTTVTVTFKQGATTKYAAKLETDETALTNRPNPPHVVNWKNTRVNPIQAAAGDRLTGEINVATGYYIQQVVGVTAAGAVVPVTVSGNGYNNGTGTAGSPVTVQLTMPAAAVTVTVIYAQGVPPEEPVYRATLVEKGQMGLSYMTLKNEATGATAPNGKFVTAKAGEMITGALTVLGGNRAISAVRVECGTPGVNVTWVQTAPNKLEFTMPAANVTVTVETGESAGSPKLTLTKHEFDANGNRRSIVEANRAQAIGNQTAEVGKSWSDFKLMTGGANVAVNLWFAAGFDVDSLLRTDTSGTRPLTLQGDPQGGPYPNYRANFSMPPNEVAVDVTYREGLTPPPPGTYPLTLVVDDPDNTNVVADNHAVVSVNGGTGSAQAKQGKTVTIFVAPGDEIVLSASPTTGFSVGPVAANTATGSIVPTPKGPNEVAFTMPAEAVAVTVPFRKATAQAYTANLIIRGAGTGTATFGAYGTKVYSITAPAGAAIPVRLFANSGSYIQAMTVTPAALGVDTTLTGVFAQQEGSFVMPAADCLVNVHFQQGWPDSVAYNATLKVSDPTGNAANKSILTNETQYATTGYLTGTTKASITGPEYAVMAVEINSAQGFLPEISVMDSTGKHLAYTWKSQTVLSFAMPADHVTVDVRYRKATASDYKVTLHVTGATGANGKVEVRNFEKSDSITWPGGDMVLNANNPGNAILVTATPGAGYHVQSVLVMCGGQLIAFQTNSDSTPRDYFIMPSGNVDIYVTFTDTEPPAGAVTAALAVTADAVAAGSGTIVDTATDGKPTTVSAMGIGQITVAPEGKVQVKVMPDTGNNYTVTDIRLTPVGSSISQSVPFTWTGSDQVEFTMPDQDVAVEAVLEQVTAPSYSAQIVVNGSILGTPAGSAILRTSSTAPGGAAIDGIIPGSPLEAVVTVNPGYVINSILVVPQLSGGNFTPGSGANQTQVVPFTMPTNNVIVYVDFGIDPAAVYEAKLTVSHAGTDTSAENKASISSVRQSTPGEATDGTPATAPAAAGEMVTVAVASHTDYSVDGYTVTDAAGKPVACIGVQGGFTFVMPAGNAAVNVVYTKGLPTARNAVLHVTDTTGITDTTLKVTMSDAPANEVVWVQGQGDQTLSTAATQKITVTAALPADTYVAAAYALHNGQVYPFTMPTGKGATTSTGEFYMPAGNVDVYVELKSETTQPPQDYAALLMVNGPARAGSATMTGVGKSVTVQSGAPHGYISALPDSVFTVTVAVSSGYVIDTVVGTQTAVTPTANPNEYTFTLPAAANAGAIVTLKESTTTGKELTLHVGHATGATTNPANSAEISFVDGTTTYKETVTAGHSGKLAAVPSGRAVTLTVTPQEGHYVDAAYALTGTTLVPLSKALEKSMAVNTASFNMPATATDVYVFYKNGSPPAGAWHNVVFLSTDVDTNGAITNSGKSSATITVDGGTASTIKSDATPVNYYNVTAGKSVALTAIAGEGYGFAAVTATPALAFSPASDPTKTDYTFPMPTNNVAVVMNFKPGSVTAELKLTVEDLSNTAVNGDTNLAELTLTGNTTGTPDLSVTSTSAAGGTATKTDVTAGTAATINVTAASGYTPWAELKTTLADGTLKTVLVPLTQFTASNIYTATITTAATNGEVVVHMLKAPKVVVLVNHKVDAAPHAGNTLALSYPGVPPLTANKDNAGTSAGVSIPIPAGTIVTLTTSIATGYEVASITIIGSSTGPITPTPVDAVNKPNEYTFTMPTPAAEVVTITVTFGNEVTTRELDMELLQDTALTPAAHGSAKIDWDTMSETLNNDKLTHSFPAVKIGDTVTVTVTPDTDYRAKVKLTSTDAAGQPVITYLPVTGNVATFPMPNRDAQVEIEFISGYSATLVLHDTSTRKDNKAEMTTDETDGARTIKVDADDTTADPTKDILTEIVGGTTLSVTPTIASGSRSVLKGIMVTETDSGSTTFITELKGSAYEHIINSDVTITVVTEDDTTPHSYLAAVAVKGEHSALGNKAEISNVPEPGALNGNIWTRAKETQRIEVTVTLAPGYYASMTAKTQGTDAVASTAVPLLNAGGAARLTLTETGTYHFAMPADNVAITVTYFEKDYIAQLFVVDETGLPGNKAAISYEDRHGQHQEVDYNRGMLVGLEKADKVHAYFTLAADVVSVGVVANNLKTGASLATATSGGLNYQFDMPAADVAVSTVFGLVNKDLRIAAMKMEAWATIDSAHTEIDITTTKNTASVKNLTPPPTTKAARAAAPYSIGLDDGYNTTWVTGYPSDVIEITFQSEQKDVDGGTQDFYTQVTALNVSGGALTVLQQGSLGAGTARFIMPNANVQAMVTFDTTPPTVGDPKSNLDVTVKGHEGVEKNQVTLSGGTHAQLLLKPTNGVADPLTGKIEQVGKDTVMTLATATAAKYRVASAELETTVDTIKLTLPLKLDADGKATFKMPNVATTLVVTYATNFNATLNLSPTSLTGVSMAAPPGTPASVSTHLGKIEGIPTGTKVKTTAPATAGALPLRAVLATTAGGGTTYLTEKAGTWDFTMDGEDVNIFAVYDTAPTPDPDRYVAAVEHGYQPNSTVIAGNGAKVATSTAGLSSGSIWTEAQENDTVTTTVTLAAGYSAIVTATAKDDKGVPMKVTYKGKTDVVAKVTATGEVTLTMPADVNVQISVVFVQGYTATLKVPDTNPAGSTYSVTDGKTVITDNGKQIENLKGTETISTTVTPGVGSETSAVVITKESGSEFATPADPYTYTMPTEDITVTPIVSTTATETKDKLYIAAVNSEGATPPDDAIQGIVNQADATLAKGDIWAAGKEKHQMEVSFTTGARVYARVTAVRKDTGATLDVLQLGVTGSGKAYFVMPAANVQVTVEYSNRQFNPVDADLVSKGHGGKVDNLSTVTHGSGVYPLTPTAGDNNSVTDKIASVEPGTRMSMAVQRNATYSVKAVELSLTGVTGGPVLSITLDAMGLATVLVPTGAATLTFIYDPTPPTPQPWDPDGSADETGTPKLDEGHLTATNHATLPDTVDVTMPALYGPGSTGTPTLFDTRIDANGDGNADPRDFFADFRFYYDKSGTMTELVVGTDVTLGAISYAPVSGRVGAAFTLTGVTDDVKKLISDGGIIYVTATQQRNLNEAANHPESNKTQLVLPGPGFGPRPYDPGNMEEIADPILNAGYIYAANYGDRGELDIPVLLDHKGDWSNADSTDLEFKFYVQTGVDGEGKPDYLPLTTEDTPDGSGGTIPADIVLTRGTDPVETPNQDSGLPDYQGVHFTLALKDGYTSDAAKALALMLDNSSSIDATDKKTRLFVTATSIDNTTPDTPKPGPESDKTEIWLPSYKTISGTITSYAPTHPATVSLYAESATTPDTYEKAAILTATVQEAAGTGRWRQSFELKSSELTVGANYRLVLEKPSHITRTADLLNLPFTNLKVDTGELELYCGDIDGDGMILLNDRTWVQRAMGQTVDTTVDGAESTLAYWADLDGDSRVTLADLTILERHMGKRESDYQPVTIARAGLRMFFASLPLGPSPEEPMEEPPPEAPVEEPEQVPETPEEVPDEGAQEDLPQKPLIPILPETPQIPDIQLPPPPTTLPGQGDHQSGGGSTGGGTPGGKDPKPEPPEQPETEEEL